MLIFTDAILRAPVLGCMLMCLASSLVGVLVFIRKESLLGETLSHATYPGIMFAALIASFFSKSSAFGWSLVGAAITCCASLLLMRFCQKTLKLNKDSSLCFVLTLFFGIGLTLSSYIQQIDSRIYKQARAFLFGQAATITDQHLIIYALLTAVIILCIIAFFKELRVANSDPLFAHNVGINLKMIDALTYCLLVFSVIVGLRSIGLFMLSGMLIGPAISARQWTDKLHWMFVLAALFGLLSGFFGIYTSIKVAEYSRFSASLATGATILLVSAFISVISLLCSPKRGWITRFMRITRFKKRCCEENILKSLWHFKQKNHGNVAAKDVFSFQGTRKITFQLLVKLLHFKGHLVERNKKMQLTEKGARCAKHIVRMHRLWELYLVNIGVGKDRVHHSAEEMEHIITPEIELQLLKMMNNPTKDPHNQPIPCRQ